MWPGGTPRVVVGTLKMSLYRLPFSFFFYAKEFIRVLLCQ